ncbi:MAG: NADH:quinone oxidoreductase subunit RnfC [Deltaproteobacteria bacterium HGW-Deltaproteobacteria-18]|jgi:electron transport complex protein RnfC|nr:MAG: NADH:quinone oxidoreductase subunit RnfC [Deltaproteobacteria bacterium HGW-Deltaproteobacteria-18]
MMKLRLNTSVEIKDTLQEVPTPLRVRIPIESKHKPVVKKKQILGRGQVIAENPTKGAYGIGFVHSSIDGVVEDILPDAIVIGPIPASKEGEEPVSPPRPELCNELDSLENEDLCRKMLELGVDTSRFHSSRTLIINGLNPEPGVLVSEQLIKDAQDVLKAGLQVLERAIKPGVVKLVVANGKQLSLHGCTTVNASDVYPATIDPLVVYAATGAERPDNVDVISISTLYRIGLVATTKLPLMEAVVSVGEKVYRVPAGMTVQDLLDVTGVAYGMGWKLALNGPMRGVALSDLGVGIAPTCTAVTLVPDGLYPPVQPNPCINCGECVLVCPARIHPGMLSRYAEFNMFESTQSQHVGACFECGMCTFVCPASRPVMQYLLLAKKQLAAQDEAVSTCRLQD